MVFSQKEIASMLIRIKHPGHTTSIVCAPARSWLTFIMFRPVFMIHASGDGQARVMDRGGLAETPM